VNFALSKRNENKRKTTNLWWLIFLLSEYEVFRLIRTMKMRHSLNKFSANPICEVNIAGTVLTSSGSFHHT